MRFTFRHTRYCCYASSVSHAAVNNLAPLLFLTFQRQFGITLSQLALLVSLNFAIQMQREKLPPAQIKKNLGLPGFAADRTLRQAAGYTGWQARRAMEACLRAEYQVKSGAWNQEGALEAAMLEIFQLRKGGGAR